MVRIFALVVSAIALAGCGGESTRMASEIPEPSHAYTPTAGTHHSYAPYASPSYWQLTLLGNIHIGGDIAPRERLDLVAEMSSGVDIYMGASRDGVGVARLENYETDLLDASIRNSFRPFTRAPLLYIDSDFYEPENLGIRLAVIDSLFLLNDALPPEFQMIFMGPSDASYAAAGEIIVSLDDPETISARCGETALACALPGFNRAFVRIPNDLDTGEYIFPRSVIVHELLHALGIRGHVDSIEFPDSIMGTAGEYIPNGRHIISKIDREVLQIMYMSQLTSVYNDWGEWSDTSFHLMGQSEDEEMQFGVALFNGLPQPWAHGVFPETFLDEGSAVLSGSVTWDGNFVGFSGPSPLFGFVEFEVDMATVTDYGSEHDLRFRDIFYVSRLENQDFSAESDRWFTTPDIDYKVTIVGNLFSNVIGDDYEDGWIDGAFMGAEHEHMAGTVKRTDMIGAFGGSR